MKQLFFSIRTKNLTAPLIILIILCALASSCKKFLDKKPLKAQVVPSTLKDLMALLDNQNYNNDCSQHLLELMGDNYYLTSADWQSYISMSSVDFRSLAQHYIWDGQAIPFDGWIQTYQKAIYTSNTVLDYLPKVATNGGEGNTFNYVKGAALFYRAYMFERMAQIYCKPYQASTAATDLGLVLRTTSSVTTAFPRASNQATYDMILTDLKTAAALLPVTTAFPTRPSKAAAFGELARTYLYMREYDSAGHYANLALGLKDDLVDYNTRVPVGAPPMTTFNAEVIFHSVATVGGFMFNTTAKIDSFLYQSYDANDLRKTVFFIANTGANAGTYGFRGSYHGNLRVDRGFDGIATDELYLIRAECYAKMGNTTAAMQDLNTLMKNRWNSSTWTDFTAATATEALQKIRTERRKELVWRGQRWSDVRRYNLEDSSITLKRIVSGITYTLPPNDKRGQVLIPWSVINISGIEQNPR